MIDRSLNVWVNNDVMEQSQQLSLARPELRPALAGEARLLRSICYIVIKEMTLELEP